jgi:hypothetical protein
MLALLPADLLTVWERAGAEPTVARPAALLAAAGAAADPAAMPLGERDAALLRWYAGMFGDRLEALATCPSCATVVELSVSCTELLDAAAGVPVRPVETDGYVVAWRLPTAADLAALTACRDVEKAGAMLLAMCVRTAERDGAAVPVDDLPAPVRQAVGAAMAEADPLAENVLSSSCPQCTAAWPGRVDPGSFVWRQVHLAALRLMREVHTLARAYGWTEPEILALSPARRAVYLRLVNDG